MKRSDCTVLILSCDTYHDLWRPFFYSLTKYWKKPVFPVVLGSNTIKINNTHVKTLLSGPDKDWSTSLLAILRQITTPYIFLWLDDMFPTKKLQNSYFMNVIEFMKKRKAVHIHTSPIIIPDRILPGGKFGEYTKGEPYRVTAMGFWDVSALKKLLLPGENPWNFEILGSYRSSYLDGFYCVMDSDFSIINVIEKGKVLKKTYEYFQKNGIPLDISKRKVITEQNLIHNQLGKIFFSMMIKVPWRFRLALMNSMRKILISY